ncbi:MAG: hypothetical protein ACYC0H_08355, partial [Solirubrobacteraceae bacterium]
TRPLAGQTLEFSEVGAGFAAPILETTRPRGTVALLPAVGGGARTHTIEITVDRGGLPVGVLKGARFNAAGERGPGRLGRVTLTRRGQRVTVRWAAVANARRYLVHITATDGRDLYFEQHGRSLTVADVTAPDRITVTVQALGADGLTGQPQRAVLDDRKG